MFEFRRVSKAFWKKGPKKPGGRRKKVRQVILEDCTAVFPRGRSVALLGEKGAGKSTILRLMSGIEFPDRGRMLRNARMAPLGGFPSLSRNMSGRQNCRFIARLYGIDVRSLERFMEEFTELGEQFNKPVSTYNGMMKSRMAIGLFMAPDFDCYLFDGGIWFGDPVVRERAQAMFEIKRQSASVILASNNPTQIRAYCNMGAVLHQGRLQLFEDLEEAITAFQSIGGALVDAEVQAPEEKLPVAREPDDDSEIF